MAVDVRDGDRARGPCRHRAPVHHGEPALAGVEGPDRGRGEGHQPTAQAQSRSTPRACPWDTWHQKAKATEGARVYLALFKKKNRRATILASVPWFLQDLGVYGIGIFTPTILAAVIGKESKSHALADTIHNDILGAKGSALMDVLFVLGIVVAIFLVDRVGRIKLQIVGFIGCAVGLLLSGLSIRPDGTNVMWLLFLGFTLFYFMVNFGPNGMTYLLAGEVFPTEVRGKGAGFAASFAKIGAVLTAFLFPSCSSPLARRRCYRVW